MTVLISGNVLGADRQRCCFEVDVLQSVNSIDATSVIEVEQLLKQIKPFKPQPRTETLVDVAFAGLPFLLSLTTRKVCPSRHGLLSGTSNKLEDSDTLVNICAAFQYGFALEHFAEYAAYTPQIDGGCVALEGE
jgi:hypothetical protein